MDLNELLEIERRGWESLCDGSGATFYGEIMSDDGVMVLANGIVTDRSTVTTALAEAPTWDDFTIEDPRIISAGADTGILLYRGTASRGNDPEPFDAWMTSVYLEANRRIQLVSYQQTPVGR